MGNKHGGSALLELLLHFEDGVQKHGSDPGFPDLSAICDLKATHDTLADKLVQANASKARAKEDTGAARAYVTQVELWVERLQRAIEAWAGPRSSVLRDFGLRPLKPRGKKGPRSGKAGGAAHTGTRGSGAHAHSAGATGGSGGGAAAPEAGAGGGESGASSASPPPSGAGAASSGGSGTPSHS